MKKILLLLFAAMLVPAISAKSGKQQMLWPDGTPMDAFFRDTAKVDVSTLGRQYVVTDYGVSRDSTIVQTAALHYS